MIKKDKQRIKNVFSLSVSFLFRCCVSIKVYKTRIHWNKWTQKEPCKNRFEPNRNELYIRHTRFFFIYIWAHERENNNGVDIRRRKRTKSKILVLPWLYVKQRYWSVSLLLLSYLLSFFKKKRHRIHFYGYWLKVVVVADY